MRFAPNGAVHVCGPNWSHPLGRVGERTLREIWDGPETQMLRSALADGDFGRGCQECGYDVAAGNRRAAHAASYDHFEPSPGFRWPRRLEFALSNRCNLQCVQCNGDLSSAIRAQREGRPPLESPYDDAFFDELASFLPHLETASFIGGEPLLQRECRRVWDLLLELDSPPRVHVTTNATVWNESIEHYVRALRMDVAVSIDGVSAGTNDAIRVGSTIERIRQVRGELLEATRAYGGTMTVNHCVMRENWHEFGAFLEEAEALGLWVHAIRLLDPASRSIFTLPADELATIVDTWQSQDQVLMQSLVVNRYVWSSTLRAAVGHLGTLRATAEVPVEVAERAEREARRQVTTLCHELTGWAERPPLQVSVVDGAVASVVCGGVEIRADTVDVAPWAAILEPTRWLGRDVVELLPMIENGLGLTLGPPTTSEVGGAQLLTMWLSSSGDEPAPTFELRTGFVPWEARNQRHLELVIAIAPVG